MSTKASQSVQSEFGPWLQHQIKRMGLNQSEFASKVGVRHATVSRWVSGRIPEASLIERIADVLVLDYDLVATKAGYRPAMHEVPQSEREARVMELARRIDWDRDEIALRLAVSQLEELAEVFRKAPADDQD